MKTVIYNVVAYRKGATGRKGNIFKSIPCISMSQAIATCQKWIYEHEDLYYYSIERNIINKND